MGPVLTIVNLLFFVVVVVFFYHNKSVKRRQWKTLMEGYILQSMDKA